ncbi:MAG TPA: DUF6152 family protein [Gammaproteobacteria bacterium]|nr:DUF6152 family protein [Gammaproteobacteria bacterium]
MLERISAFIASVGVVAAAPAFAHHSLAIYSNETTVVEGEIVDILWANPHVRITLRAGLPGIGETWRLESGSLMTLQRAGITPDVLRKGDRVKAAVRVSKRDPLLAGALTVLLPDGRELQLLTGAPAYFTNDASLVRAANTVSGDPARENRGFFRVWSVPYPNPVGGEALRRLAFKPAAVEARSKFDLYDNFATRCEPEGLPRIMFNPHPFEFIDRGAAITLRTELYDTERTIHMDRTAPPPGEPPSRLGYSVGKWEQGTLVIATSLVSWPYFDNIGTPQSGDVRIVERYTLAEEQSRLDFEVTVTDSVTFAEPAVVKGHWLALGETVPRYDCRPAAR